MKFDPECVRDILIATEERTDGESMEWLIPGPVGAASVPGLSAYPYNVAVYHIKQCAQSGLIKLGSDYIDYSFELTDLTPRGHQLLADLRKPQAMKLWEKAKNAGILASIDSVVSWALGIGEMLLK